MSSIEVVVIVLCTVALTAILIVVPGVIYLWHREKWRNQIEEARMTTLRDAGNSCHVFQAEMMKQITKAFDAISHVMAQTNEHTARNTATLERVEDHLDRFEQPPRVQT